MENSNAGPDLRKKARFYFVTGYVFLIAMALFWSVDDSLIFIFLGIAVYFFYLGIHAWPKKNTKEPFQTSGYQTRTENSEFASVLKNVFRKQHQSASPSVKPFSKTGTSESNRRVTTLVILAIFATFLIFFIGSIFSNSDNGYDATAYFQTAEQQYWNGNYDSAYLNYRRALTLNDKYAEAMVGYGNVMMMRNQYDSAMIMFDKALEIEPHFNAAAYNKALVYYNQQKYDESINVLNPVLESNPEYYDGMLLAGDSYYAKKKYDEALAWYEIAYENGGERSVNLCHIMGYIYDTKGDYSKAIDLYKEVLSYDSTVVNIHQRLGELLPNEEGNFYRTQVVKLQQQ
ncbi:tetratricopeptide repeat protein [Chryseolinea sp. H1M3-3]|uniref:tetratricopeptide repeat protein n=1 Tax=Chryseolinea sp. H1M3-3 TaxID=3034144 RepID=UPI0023EBB9FD|nr:tetratricopeptide repeat protein [Chryseolinea sp. H1M3-3]